MMGELLCRSCPSDYPFPATHIANAYGTKKDGSVLDWPVCGGHLPFAMVAGWFPIRPAVREAEAPTLPSGNLPSGDDWIEWKGGECPLGNAVEHEVKFRNGETETDDEPDTWRWQHDESPYDIIAYRVVKHETQ